MALKFKFNRILIIICIYFFSPFFLYAADKNNALIKGLFDYVPVYSHIYSGDKEKPFLLAVTLSIRNIDPTNQIRITMVDYYETQGDLLKKYTDKPIILKPLESIRYVIPEKDKSGGSGANFLVKWQSDKFVNPPIVETIMNWYPKSARSFFHLSRSSHFNL